jgi:hypothetical protein
MELRRVVQSSVGAFLVAACSSFATSEGPAAAADGGTNGDASSGGGGRFCTPAVAAGALLCADFDDASDPLEGWTKTADDQADYGVGPGFSPPNAGRTTIKAGPSGSPDAQLTHYSGGAFQTLELTGKFDIVSVEDGRRAEMLVISFPGDGLVYLRSDGALIEQRTGITPSYNTLATLTLDNNAWTNFRLTFDLAQGTVDYEVGAERSAEHKSLSLLHKGARDFNCSLGAAEPNGTFSAAGMTVLFDDVILRGTPG